MQQFEAIKITEKVYWVGAIDWELRNFHGYETSRGSTYNAYLILGEKPILLDTVKAPFYTEMMARISSVIDPKKIRYVISNHAEMDHSGSLPQLINAIHPEKIYASKVGVQTLQEHFHFDFPITPVGNMEQLKIGDANFTFIETKMLHWPESMFTYYTNEKILFSQDAFGMHFAASQIFAEQNDHAILRYEAAKYFANILLPYSKLVSNLLNKLPALNLDISMIAPVHGPIWSTPEDIKFIIDNWTKWAKQEFYAKAVIIYDTMWDSTAKMAHAIADGLIDENIEVKIMPTSITSRSEIIAELLEAGALLVGSPTLNQQIFPTIADALCYLQGLKPKNLIGQVFGSYGWGNEAMKILQDELTKMQVSFVAEPMFVKYVPTQENLVNCRNLGQNIGKKLHSIIANQLKLN